MLSYRRDRAAGCVSYGQKWNGTGRQYFTDIIGLVCLQLSAEHFVANHVILLQTVVK